MSWMLFFLRLALLAHPAQAEAMPVPCETQLPMPTACPCPCPVNEDGPPPARVPARPVKFLVLTKRVPPPAYDVAVTPCQGGAKPWMNIALPANGQALVATRSQTPGARSDIPARRLHVRHCGTVGCMAQIELKIVEPRNDGARCVYATEAKLPLGVEKTLALAGNTPEPMCVKVRVQQKAMAPGAASVCTGSIILPPAGVPMPAPAIARGMPCVPPLPAMPAARLTPASRTGFTTQAIVGCPMPPPMPVLPPMMPMMPQPVAHLPMMPVLPPMMPMIPNPVAYPVSPIAPCMYARSTTGPKTFQLVKDSGTSKIAMRADTFSTTAVRMTLEEGMAGNLRIAAGTKRVHLSGSEWKAQADKVEVAANGMVTLHGHCKLTCEKLGSGATLAGDKLTFRVRAGRFVELAK